MMDAKGNAINLSEGYSIVLEDLLSPGFGVKLITHCLNSKYITKNITKKFIYTFTMC